MAPEALPPTDGARPARRLGDRLREFIGDAGSGRRRVAVNGAWNGAVFFASALVVFFVSPLFVARLGDSAYGIWNLVVAFTGYCGLADLGVRPAIVHFIARYDALGDSVELNRYVNTAFATFSGGAVLVLLFAGVLAVFIPEWFHLPPELVGQARIAVLLLAADVALTLPPNAFTAVLVGKQRFDVLCQIDLVTMAVRTAAVVALLLNGAGIVALAALNLVANAAQIGWKMRLAFRAHPGLRFAPRTADWSRARRLLSYGVLAIVVGLSEKLIWQTNAIVIGAALSAAAITYFTIGSGFPGQVRSLCGSISRVLVPAAGALEARGERETLARMITTAARLLLLLAGPILVYLLAVGPAFLARWMGERFRGTSGEVMTVLSLGAAAPVASLPCVGVLYGTNRMRLLAVLTIIEGVANLLASVLLVRPLGILGVALGTAIPSTVMHAFVLPRLVCREYGIPWTTFFRRVWAVPVASGLVSFAALRAVCAPDARLDWLQLAALAGLSVFVFCATYALVTFAANRMLRGRFPRPTPEAAR